MVKTTQEETIMEEKEELLVSPKHTHPARKIGRFLKPLATSINNVKPYSSIINPTKKTCSLKVSFNGFRTLQRGWKDWVTRMHSFHKSTWEKAGICNAVLNSCFEIPKNEELVLMFAEKWCHESNTFVFKWGEVTVSLEDMMCLGGYSVLGECIDVVAENEEARMKLAELKEARVELGRSKYRKADQSGWMKIFKDSDSEVEHEAFLILWLSRFVFPSSSDIVGKNVFTIAVHLAQGVRLALAPAVLAGIYRDLGFLKDGIIGGETSVTVWSPLQLVQIWIWERFPKLSPVPRDGCNPRFARWEKKKGSEKKLQKNNVASIVDCGLEDFCWRPYSTNAYDDDLGFCKLFQEKGGWVEVGDCLDEELESWARCLRVSELVGINVDCIQQYLPHRVAMQFGMNQEVPADVARTNETREVAWEFYTRRVKDVKLYFPPRISEPYVTSRYLKWHNRSSGTSSLQSLFGDDEPENLVTDDEPRNKESQESASRFCTDEDDILGLDLEARIKKLEEVFAYIKHKKPVRC